MATVARISIERRSLISKVADRFATILSSESRQGYRLSGLALLAAFIPVAIVQCILGAPPIEGPWNVAILLDGAWRMIQGQAAQTDFYNPIGPMTDLFTAIGMKIATPSTSSITYGVVILAALILPLVWRIAKHRLPWALALLCTILAGTYLLSPRPPGWTIRFTGYAMIYNRESYVVFMALCLCLFLKRRYPSRRSEYVDGAIAGMLLALLLYWKITYFVAAVGVTACAAVLIPRVSRWYLAAMAAVAGVCLALFVFVGVSLPRYVANVRYAVKAQLPAMRYQLLWASLNHNAMWMYLLAFCLVLLTWTWSRGKTPPFAITRIWLASVALLGATLFIESGNSSQGGGLEDPLYFITAVIAFESFRRIDPRQVARPDSSTRTAFAASFAVILPLFFGTIVLGDSVAYAYSVAWDCVRRPHIPVSQRFHSAPLSDFYVPTSTTHNTAYWPARDFPARINDGIDLLRKHLQPGDRITTLSFTNPFNFALGIKPARDRIVFWDPHVTYDPANPPATPAQYLGDATVVMVPRLLDRSTGCCFETADVMIGLNSGYLHDHFHEVESTPTWTLYRRNPAP